MTSQLVIDIHRAGQCPHDPVVGCVGHGHHLVPVEPEQVEDVDWLVADVQLVVSSRLVVETVQDLLRNVSDDDGSRGVFGLHQKVTRWSVKWIRDDGLGSSFYTL